MIKKIFFSLLKSFTIAIIISLIGYNLYSPLKKDPIYQVEILIEPNPLLITFGKDTSSFSKLKYMNDSSNSYEVLKFLEKYVKSLHKYQTIGACSLKKINGRVPYSLTKSNQYYELINLKLLGNEETLKKCDQDIRGRIKNLFDEKKMIMISDYNEIQLYNSRYEIKKKSMDMLLSMRLFEEKISDMTKIKDIYENLNESYLDYYNFLNEHQKTMLKKYQHINSLDSEITLHEDGGLIINYFFTPLIIILNLFLIILISTIDLIYFKKIKLNKIYNFLFR